MISVSQDVNHSHFIFADDEVTPHGGACFGKETKLRADFEACVAASYPPHAVLGRTGQKDVIRPYPSGAPSRAMEEHILSEMKTQDIGWDHMSLKTPGRHSQKSAL